jgi:hypothetical protein
MVLTLTTWSLVWLYRQPVVSDPGMLLGPVRLNEPEAARGLDERGLGKDVLHPDLGVLHSRVHGRALGKVIGYLFPAREARRLLLVPAAVGQALELGGAHQRVSAASATIVGGDCAKSGRGN